MKIKILAFDTAFGGHLTLAIIPWLILFLENFKAVFGYSEWLTFFSGVLSLFILIPSIVIIVPTVIVLSLLLRNVYLFFLTLLLVLTLAAFFNWKANTIFLLPYSIVSIRFSFEWFSQRRKNLHS